jgi:hypothetical protein
MGWDLEVRSSSRGLVGIIIFVLWGSCRTRMGLSLVAISLLYHLRIIRALTVLP